MPLISIIVPVYQTQERYLRQCIESLTNQTFTDIEIILIDDGTPDNGGFICEEYADIDQRIKVVHQKNQGVSAARNNGMKIATGKWITFVDADDWIEHDTCEKLQKTILKKECDFLIFSLKVNFPNKEKDNPFWYKNNTYLEKEDREQLQLQILYKTISNFSPPYNMVGVAVCKLYKRDFLIKNNLKFNTELPLSEDGVFAFLALERAEKVYYVNEFLYHYRKHGGSATLRYRENAVEDYSKGLKELKTCLITCDKGDLFYTALYYRAIFNIFAICNQLHCNQLNPLPVRKRVKNIKKLLNTDLYYSAISKINLRHYSKNSGYSQKIGYFLIKFRLYFLFYSFIVFKNSLKEN